MLCIKTVEESSSKKGIIVQSTKEITFITNCHPNERVGRKFGALVAGELEKRGYSVDIVRMSETCDVNGKEAPWWRIYTIPGREDERAAEEMRLAKEASGVAVSWHDDPFDKVIGRQLSPKATVRRVDEDVGFPLAVVEVRTPLRLAPERNMDRDRIRAGLETAERLDVKRAGYIVLESSLDDVDFKPYCIKKLADSVEEAIIDPEYAEFIRE